MLAQKPPRKFEAIRDALGGVSGWELEELGLNNPLKPSNLDHWFAWICFSAPTTKGHLAEFGVFRGASLIPAALLMKKVAPEKKIYGFDSFAGFPRDVDERDDLKMFWRLAADEELSREHLRNVEKHIEIVERFRNPSKLNSVELSSSRNFSDTSLARVKELVSYFELDNVELVAGTIEERISEIQPDQFAGALIDCDLYSCYEKVLTTMGASISRAGGIIVLDEFFSLKFPGPRIAVNRYLEENSGQFNLSTRFDPVSGLHRAFLEAPENSGGNGDTGPLLHRKDLHDEKVVSRGLPD